MSIFQQGYTGYFSNFSPATSGGGAEFLEKCDFFLLRIRRNVFLDYSVVGESRSRTLIARTLRPLTFGSDGIRVDLRASSRPFSLLTPLDPLHESLGM